MAELRRRMSCGWRGEINATADVFLLSLCAFAQRWFLPWQVFTSVKIKILPLCLISSRQLAGLNSCIGGGKKKKKKNYGIFFTFLMIFFKTNSKFDNSTEVTLKKWRHWVRSPVSQFATESSCCLRALSPLHLPKDSPGRAVGVRG